jgi:preflagellin peptidase FlaK
MFDLDLIRISIAFVALIYCSYSDLKRRKVTNKLWLPLVVIGIALAVVEYIENFNIYDIAWFLISFLIVFFTAYIIFSIGAFGGADAKSFITMALLFSLEPLMAISPSTGILAVNPPIGMFPMTIFPLTVLINSILITILIPISILVYNLLTLPKEERSEKPSYLFMCLKKKKEEIDEVKMKIMEDMGEKAWVTPKIPLMVFITAGFITALLYGDIIYGILSAF